VLISGLKIISASIAGTGSRRGCFPGRGASCTGVNADAAGGRHAVFERNEKIWLPLFAASLMLQRGAMGSFCPVSPKRFSGL